MMTPSTQAAGQFADLASRFHQHTAPTVGAEIELYIVDSRTGQPRPLFNEIYQQLPPDIQQQTEGEFLACQIEFATTPFHSVDEVHHQLRQFVDAATVAARCFNAELLWSGTHPTWQFERTMIRDCERSWHNCRRFGALIHQLSTCGLHVHVAVRRDRAIAVVDGLQRFLPLLVALAANSAVVNSQDTGRRTQRALTWSSGFPVCGLCGPFGDWDGFQKHCETLVDSGLIESQKDLYYFVRPTRYGTVEVRCCDLPCSLEQSVALTALIQTLVAWLQQTDPPEIMNHDLLRVELFHAITHGPDALLTDHHGQRRTPLEWMQTLTQECETLCRQIGTLETLKHAPAVLANNGSTRQLEHHCCGRSKSERAERRRSILRSVITSAAVVLPLLWAVAG